MGLHTANALEAFDHCVTAISSDHSWSLHGRVGSALMWMCALDESFWPDAGYEKARDVDTDGQVIPGLRRARDAVVHQLTQTNEHGGLEYPLFGGTGTLNYPDRWVDLGRLGPPASKSPRLGLQERMYQTHVAGQTILRPLLRARNWIVAWRTR